MMKSGWTLKKLSGPEVTPITLDRAKGQCEIDADITEHDTLLQGKIGAATDMCEGYCQATFCATTYLLTGSEFHCEGVELPMGPVQEIVKVSYLDASGNRIEMPPEDYALFAEGQTDYLIPAFGKLFPAARCYPGSIAIEYIAGHGGHGSPASEVPDGIQEAVAIYTATLFENREASVVGTTASELPLGLRDMLQRYRRYP